MELSVIAKDVSERGGVAALAIKAVMVTVRVITFWR